MKKTLLVIAAVLAATSAMAAEVAVTYPKGYRNWQHVKSMVIEQGHSLYGAFGGIHHLYANDKAIAGYKKGKFDDGAVIAFDLLEASRADGTLTEGARKVLGVMHKDSKKYAATGGWGFEAFAGGDKTKRVVASNAVSACYGCHTAQEKKDYVFSQLRE